MFTESTKEILTVYATLSGIGKVNAAFGGANVIVVASEDTRAKALSVKLTFADGERVIVAAVSEDEKLNFLSTIEKMEKRKVKSGKEMMVPKVKVLSDEQSKKLYQEYADKFSALKIKIPFLTIAETLRYNPVEGLAHIKAPILITTVTSDSVNPLSESYALFDAANETKEFFELEGYTHYEVYQGKAFEKTASKQVEWFKSYL